MSNPTPLIHEVSKKRQIPKEFINVENPIYDPITQTSNYNMMGKSTSCAKGTSGTEPKNEADHVMDDN